MTDKIDDTFRRRLAEKTGDSRHWSPRDALEAAIAEIDAGASVDRLVVHMLLREPDGSQSHDFFAANLSYEQHIALLESAKHRALEDWWS